MRKSNYLFLTANNKNIKIFLIRHFCYFLSRMRAKDAWQAICVPVHHTMPATSATAPGRDCVNVRCSFLTQA